MANKRLEYAFNTRKAMTFFAASNTEISDSVALEMKTVFPTWPDGTNENGEYVKGQIVFDESNGIIYRVLSEKVTPLENQPPHAEGMLSVYRPIEHRHAGTINDPIPWVYGMDCFGGKYYSYNGKKYKVADGGDMIPCVWPPDTSGLWQWELVE